MTTAELKRRQRAVQKAEAALSEAKHNRDMAICEAVKEGRSRGEVGRLLGLTTMRVSQIASGR